VTRWALVLFAVLASLVGACTVTELTEMTTWGDKPATEGVRKDFDVVIGGIREVPIGTIEWRAAVDVYINIPNADAFGGSTMLGSFWKLYAVSGAARVVVAGNSSRPSSVSGGGFPIGDAYVLGARNVVCDHFELTVQNPNGEVAAPGEPSGRATILGWGTQINGPPLGIPSGLPDPALSVDPVAITDPIQPKGGAGTWGTGTTHDGPHAAALANFRGVVSSGNRTGVVLVEMMGYTTAAGQNWIQIFDGNAPFVYPPNGTVALVDFPLSQNQGVAYTPQGGLRFRDGILWAISSTPRTMTQVAGTTCWFDTSYYR
jgi:hypothetical protein